jgi:hypothetical protein
MTNRSRRTGRKNFRVGVVKPFKHRTNININIIVHNCKNEAVNQSLLLKRSAWGDAENNTRD